MYPQQFFLRGDYVLRGGSVDLAENVIESALFPLHYPDANRGAGPRYPFDADGGSEGLTGGQIVVSN